MHVNHATTLPRGFAFGALAAFVAGLILPAIHEPAYFDSHLGKIEEHAIHGFACVAGLCISAWFTASHFFYLFANIAFIILTPLLMRQTIGLALHRSLLMLVATVAPIHLIAFQHQRIEIGVYFWLLAFVMSSIGHWLRFLSTASSFSTAVSQNSQVAAG
jgi:hypothetical protein